MSQLELADAIMLRDTHEKVDAALNEVRLAADELQRLRSQLAQATAHPPATVAPHGTSDTDNLKHRISELERDKAVLLREQAELHRLRDDERVRHAEELARSKRAVLSALRRSFADTFRALGASDPWEEGAQLRAQVAAFQQNVQRQEQVSQALRAELEQSKSKLQTMRDAKAASQHRADSLDSELRAAPAKITSELLAKLVNRLGVTKVGALLSGATQPSLSMPVEDSMKVLRSLAAFLRDQEISAIHQPGERVQLTGSADLSRYQILDGEPFHPGYADVVLPGTTRGDEVLVKAQVRYVEVSDSDGTSDEQERSSRGPADGDSTAAASAAAPEACASADSSDAPPTAIAPGGSPTADGGNPASSGGAAPDD